MHLSKTILNYRLSLKWPIFKCGVQYATFFFLPELPPLSWPPASAATRGLGPAVLVPNAGMEGFLSSVARSPGVKVFGLKRFNWVLLGTEGTGRMEVMPEPKPSPGACQQLLLAKQS